MHVLIVGSGLSAMAVQVALSEKFGDKIEITFMDTNFRYQKDFENSVKLDAKKTYFGSEHMYSKMGYANTNESEVPLSYAAGGLSTVWGAGIRLWDGSFLEENVSKLDGFYRSAQTLLLNIPYIGDNETLNLPKDYPIKSNSLKKTPSAFQTIRNGSDSLGTHIFDTPLAVYIDGPKTCVGCGLCLSGCPYGSIFSSSQYFDNLVLRNRINRVQGKVETLRQIGEKVEVKHQNHAGQSSLSFFDRVYVCAGAVGTPIILMQSRLTPSKLQIKDSQVFYFIGLYKRPKNKLDFNFSLSQKTITDRTNFSASLYECNKDVRNRMKALLKEKCLGLRIPVPSLVDHFFFLGIGFLDSDHSGTIEVFQDSKGDIIFETQQNLGTAKSVRQAIKTIKRRLRRDGFWVIGSLTQTPPVGTGFHLGAGLPIGSEHVAENGMLRKSNRIYVADVSLLPKLFAGSHTFNSMSLNHQLIMEDFK